MSRVFRTRSSSVVLSKRQSSVLTTPPPSPGFVAAVSASLSNSRQASGTDDSPKWLTRSLNDINPDSSETETHPVDDVGIRNLATLSNISEDIICAELHKRYMKDIIYTYVGEILIAINPFRDLLEYYSDNVSKLFALDTPVSPIPHVFRVALMAYKNMTQGHKNQCCVISGESGAGKTETAKFLVEQIMTLCKGTGSLEQKILQANPLLEAFGNAKTVINNNSSRFGKFLEIKFGFYGEVLGATLAEYLLEKSRVVVQADGERNFHVFYYLFHGLSRDALNAIGLTDSVNYHYLRGGFKNVTKDGIIDLDVTELKKQFEALVVCMASVGFTEHDIAAIHKILAIILHLGNVDITEQNEIAAVSTDDQELHWVSKLLHTGIQDLAFTLQSNTVKMRGELLQTNYKLHQAEDNRDAMAKALYGRLFAWIVQQANQMLSPRTNHSDSLTRGVTDIGILDIFGFENFQQNSFEQFCINIANEQLQFYFNQNIFANEIQAYEAEGIDCQEIKYYDNRGILDMIFSRPVGLFSLLDEESHFPKATASSLVAKFSTGKDQCNWTRFQRIDHAKAKSATQRKTTVQDASHVVDPVYFGIEHYAGLVVYDAAIFLEKNRDTLSRNVQFMLHTVGNKFVAQLFKDVIDSSEAPSTGSRKTSVRGADNHKLSVSATFKNSLNDLMTKMLNARPHFIRCVKPNNNKAPLVCDRVCMLTQLRYTGVFETTRIRRDGFPLRLAHREFIDKYYWIALTFEKYHATIANPTPDALVAACDQIIRVARLSTAQVGKSLVFLKYYHEETLLRLSEMLSQRATKITKTVRAFLARRRLKALRAAKLKAEADERARIERLAAERLAAERAAAEKAELERAAAEAAKLAAEADKLKKEKEQATIRRRKHLEEIAQATEAKQQEALRIQQELALEMQRKEEERKRAEEELARQELEAKQKDAEEQQRLQAERDQKRARTQAEYELAKQQGEESGVDKVKSGANLLLVGEPVQTDEGDGSDQFSAIFGDDEVDEDERQELKRLKLQRDREEAQRKRKLKEEHEEALRQEAEEQMRALQLIFQAKKEEEAARARDLEVAQKEAEKRLENIDWGFNFSWGTESVSTTPAAAPKSTPAPAPTPVSAPPVPATPASMPSTSTPASAPSPTPPRASTPTPASAASSSGGTVRASHAPLASTLPRPKPPAPPVSQVFPAKAAAASPTPDASSSPVPTSSAPHSEAHPAPINSAPTISAPSAPSAAPSVAPPAAPSGEPRRRVLVRGGNASKETYLPGYLEALTLLDNLESFLTHEEDESPKQRLSVSPVRASGDRSAAIRLSPTPFGLSIPEAPSPSRVDGTIRLSPQPSPTLPRANASTATLFEEPGTRRKNMGTIDRPPPPPIPAKALLRNTDSTSTLFDESPSSSCTRRSTMEDPMQVPSARPSTATLFEDSPPPVRRVPPPVAPKPSSKSVIQSSPLAPRGPEPPAAVEAVSAPPPVQPAAPVDGEPVKRRALVRGGNATKVAYVPGYVEAMASLDLLDSFLDDADEADDENDASDRAASTTPTPDAARHPSQDAVSAMQNFLLIKEDPQSSPVTMRQTKTGTARMKSITDVADISKEQWVESSATLIRGTKLSRSADSSSVNLQGTTISPADLIEMPVQQRATLLHMVKAGQLSVDEAMNEVVEHKNRQNCVVM
eukprot:m.750591 g.750591  ORF g.750591 m.750591 type:complete len:1671 (+) comp58981_c0_seq6:1033-6045(+)